MSGPGLGFAGGRASKAQKQGAHDLYQDMLNAPCSVNDNRSVDPDQVLSVYISSFGDVFKTGRACGLSPQKVTEMAEAHGWLARIREVIDLKKMDSSADVARAMSRASNFIQANRLRLYVERITRQLSEVPEAQLLEPFTQKKVNKAGETVITGFSFRILADLASALEKTHWMLYQSLEDGVPERQARRKAEAEKGGGVSEDVHAKIARAMAGMQEQPHEAAEKALEIIGKPIAAEVYNEVPPPTTAPSDPPAK